MTQQFRLFQAEDPNKPLSHKKPDGYAYATGPNGIEEYDTKQCCHCGGHWNFVAGSGRRRGWCTLCNNMTCGKPACHEHFPIEKRMDMFEKGLLPYLMAPTDAVLTKEKAIPKEFIGLADHAPDKDSKPTPLIILP